MMKGKLNCGVLAYWLTIIGALNWGLIGLGDLFGKNWNVVYLLVGRWSIVESIVYLLVGISAITILMGCKKDPRCE